MTTYTMQAKENYDPTRATEASGAGFPTTTFVDTHLLGWSYDATHRELVYSAIINRAAGSTTVTNTTGFTLWDGQNSVINGATMAVDTNWNYYMARKNIDTGTVTFYDAYNVNQLVPAGIGGSDGTWRRFVKDTAQTDQYPILTDPRTGDAFTHMESCELYVFRRADNYALAISPLVPVGNLLNPVLPVGLMSDYLYATEFTHTTPVTTRNLYMIPRQNTAAEITADKLLIYATFTFPSDFGADFFAPGVLDGNGAMWYLVWGNNTPQLPYKLFKFTKPSPFVYPTPPVDGGFSEVTPWTSTTGPNATPTNVSTQMGAGRACLCWSPGRTQINILTTSVDPNDVTTWTLSHTWYNTSNGTWGTSTLATAYMTAAFVPTADFTIAAYATLGRVYPVNTYLEKDAFYPDGDYATRWFFTEICPVNNSTGVIDTTQPRLLLMQLQWNAGAAPTILRVIDELSAWDPAYAAYGAAIGNTRVVRASITENHLTFGVGFDPGLYDPTTGAFWWSGMTSDTGIGDNMFHLDAAFTGRIANNAQPPLLRLAFTGAQRTQGHVY